MRDSFVRRFPGVPLDHLLTENVSRDTATNAAEVAKLIETRPSYESLSLISVSYHVRNAAKLFRRYGVPIDQTYASDHVLVERAADILGEGLVDASTFIHDWFGLPRIKHEIRNERFRSVLLATIDRRGKLLGKLTKRSRI